MVPAVIYCMEVATVVAALLKADTEYECPPTVCVEAAQLFAAHMVVPLAEYPVEQLTEEFSDPLLLTVPVEHENV